MGASPAHTGKLTPLCSVLSVSIRQHKSFEASREYTRYTCAYHVTCAEALYYNTVFCHFVCVGLVEIPVFYAGNYRISNRRPANDQNQVFPFSWSSRPSSVALPARLSL